MPGQIQERGLFLSEFFRTFRTTGAVLPSGGRLAKALCTGLNEHATLEPRRILEVGPGTGAVTTRILDSMDHDDQLDLVEINQRFVSHLLQRFEQDPNWSTFADRCAIHHSTVEDLIGCPRYDVIISGLPLNNFSADDVQRILEVLLELISPGGVLSFFEYVGIRRVKACFSSRSERHRLRAIGKSLEGLFSMHPHRHQLVLLNVPPAWAHHVYIPK